MSHNIEVIYGYRDEVLQQMALLSGHSIHCFPHSKHNKTPSTAVDLAPYDMDIPGIDYMASFANMAYIVRIAANNMGVDVVWGGDTGNEIKDLMHFELKELK